MLILACRLREIVADEGLIYEKLVDKVIIELGSARMGFDITQQARQLYKWDELDWKSAPGVAIISCALSQAKKVSDKASEFPLMSMLAVAGAAAVNEKNTENSVGVVVHQPVATSQSLPQDTKSSDHSEAVEGDQPQSHGIEENKTYVLKFGRDKELYNDKKVVVTSKPKMFWAGLGGAR